MLNKAVIVMLGVGSEGVGCTSRPGRLHAKTENIRTNDMVNKRTAAFLFIVTSYWYDEAATTMIPVEVYF